MQLRPRDTTPPEKTFDRAPGAPSDEASFRDPAIAYRFYQERTQEVIARMRRPTNPSKNTAAILVAAFETDRRLRNEALHAINSARRSSEARQTLDRTLAIYEQPTVKST